MNFQRLSPIVARGLFSFTLMLGVSGLTASANVDCLQAYADAANTTVEAAYTAIYNATPPMFSLDRGFLAHEFYKVESGPARAQFVEKKYSDIRTAGEIAATEVFYAFKRLDTLLEQSITSISDPALQTRLREIHDAFLWAAPNYRSYPEVGEFASQVTRSLGRIDRYDNTRFSPTDFRERFVTHFSPSLRRIRAQVREIFYLQVQAHLNLTSAP